MSRTAAINWRLSANFQPILAIFLVTGGALYIGVLKEGVGVFVFVFSGWLISLCLHEAAHALAAYMGGDRSVLEKGYLSLDPMAYADPMMSFILPVIYLLLGGIGLPGGGVYIKVSALRSKHWDALVSAAGPMANLALLLVLSLPFLTGLSSIVGAEIFWAATAFLAALQASSVMLNLLPIPGLDGFGIIRPYLPYHIQSQALQMSGFVGLFIMVLFISTSVGSIFWKFVWMMTSALDIDSFLIFEGYSLFRFWS